MSEKPEKQEAVTGVGIMVAAFTNEEAGEEALKALKKARAGLNLFRRRGSDPPGRGW